MPRVMANYPPMLYEALKAEGFVLPEECKDIKLVMPVDGVYQLEFVINLTDIRLAQLGRALTRIAEEAQRSI